MSESTTNALPHPLCQQLSSKKLCMVPPHEEPTMDDLESAGHTDYWCLYTMRGLGPDNDTVDYPSCHPERRCYVAPRAK